MQLVTTPNLVTYEPLGAFFEHDAIYLEELAQEWLRVQHPLPTKIADCVLTEVMTLEVGIASWTYFRFTTPRGEAILRANPDGIFPGPVGVTEEPIYQAILPDFQSWSRQHPEATLEEKVTTLGQLYRSVRGLQPVVLGQESGPDCPICHHHSVCVEGEEGLYSCQSCHLIYRRTMPVEDVLSLYTAENGGYFNQLLEQKKADHAHGYEFYEEWIRVIQGAAYLQGRAELFEQLSGQSTGRLLEVGCATGEILSVFHHRGWDVTGLELSPFCVRRAKEKYQLRLHQGTLNETALPRSSFDLALYMDVFEHIADPQGELHRIHQLLAPGGSLILELPNQGSLDASILGSDYFFDEHLFFYTPEAIYTLLESCAFKEIHLMTLHDAYNRVQRFLTDEEARSVVEELRGERLIVTARKG